MDTVYHPFLVKFPRAVVEDENLGFAGRWLCPSHTNVEVSRGGIGYRGMTFQDKYDFRHLIVL